MNKAAIKAELRRSACEDECPTQASNPAYEAVSKFRGVHPWGGLNDNPLDLLPDNWRTFFLLAAEAL